MAPLPGEHLEVRTPNQRFDALVNLVRFAAVLTARRLDDLRNTAGQPSKSRRISCLALCPTPVPFFGWVLAVFGAVSRISDRDNAARPFGLRAMVVARPAAIDLRNVKGADVLAPLA